MIVWLFILICLVALLSISFLNLKRFFISIRPFHEQSRLSFFIFLSFLLSKFFHPHIALRKENKKSKKNVYSFSGFQSFLVDLWKTFSNDFIKRLQKSFFTIISQFFFLYLKMALQASAKYCQKKRKKRKDSKKLSKF